MHLQQEMQESNEAGGSTRSLIHLRRSDGWQFGALAAPVV